MKIDTQVEIDAWNTWIGSQVKKKTGKPFKSGNKIGTIIGTCTHPVTNRMCFTFKEDDSYVEAFRCRKVN